MNIFRKCGLLLWLMRAQHDHYESKCERKSGGIDLPFHYDSENRIEFPESRFSSVIVSMRMVDVLDAIVGVDVLVVVEVAI